MSKRDDPEARAQVAIVGYLESIGLEVFAVPSGGSRNVREAVNLKKQGVRRGVTDLIVVLPGSRVLWLEVKSPPRWGLLKGKPVWLPAGKLSTSQKNFRDRRLADGGMWELVTSIVETRIALAENGISTREHADDRSDC